MIEIRVKVNDCAAAFTAAVCAESIQQAVLITKDRYPGSVVGVAFPIEPESFFVKEPGGGGRLHENHAA